MELLMEYPFPGNVRELENIIERSVALETSSIVLPENLILKAELTEPNLNREFDLPDTGIDLNKEMVMFESHLIETALRKGKGSKTKAAELLHVTPDSLRYRIEKLGLEDKPEK
jgi:two-component system response regulator PilR (NtrC family)